MKNSFVEMRLMKDDRFVVEEAGYVRVVEVEHILVIALGLEQPLVFLMKQ